MVPRLFQNRSALWAGLRDRSKNLARMVPDIRRQCGEALPAIDEFVFHHESARGQFITQFGRVIFHQQTKWSSPLTWDSGERGAGVAWLQTDIYRGCTRMEQLLMKLRYRFDELAANQIKVEGPGGHEVMNADGQVVDAHRAEVGHRVSPSNRKGWGHATFVLPLPPVARRHWL